MESVIQEEYNSTVEERETIYTILQLLFEAPLTIQTLKLWKEGFSTEFIDMLAVENGELYTFFKELKSKDLNMIEKEQKIAYQATFNVFNNHGQAPAPPWESVYVTEDRTMFGEPVFRMREQLERYGLSVVNKHKEPEDHIATQLEFMCYLISFTKKALQFNNETNYLNGIYTQYWLHKEHFNRWIEPFVMDIQAFESSDLYKGAAKLLHFFIEEDFDYIKTIKEVLEHE